MMSYINETDFVIENKELVYPEIITDGLQLYYDAKGKRDTDYHRDTMLDMSGNKNHGELQNFAYEKHSGYKDGLVFDYIDDKLVRPELNLKPDDFTFMLNGNIISFSPDGTVKRVQDGEVIESKGFNLLSEIGSKLHLSSSLTSSFRHTPISLYHDDNYPVKGDLVYVRSDIEADDDVTGIGVYTRDFKSGHSGGASNVPVVATRSQIDEIQIDGPDIGVTFRMQGSGINKGNAVFYNMMAINLTKAFGKGNEPTLEQADEIYGKMGVVPNPSVLISANEMEGNILSDMENIIDGLYKTDVLSGIEIFTDKSDDSVVYVEVDGKSVGGGENNLISKSDLERWNGTITWKDHVMTIETDSQGGVRIPSSVFEINQKYTFNFKARLISGQVNGIKGHAQVFSASGYQNDKGIGSWTDNVGSPQEELIIGKEYNYKINLTRNRDGDWLYLQPNRGDYSTPFKLELYNFQLNKGDESLKYDGLSPTPDDPNEIHSLNDFDVVSDVGRNLLLDSGKYVKNSSYPLTTYWYSQQIGHGEEVTISIKGELNRDRWALYNSSSGGVDHMVNIYELDKVDGIYTKTFNWRIGGSGNERLFIFPQPRDENENSIEWIKLERGSNPTSYTPAPEDITEDDNHLFIDKINLLLDKPLRSVGDVADRLFRDGDGLWKVERNVGEMILNGSRSYTVRANDNPEYSSYLFKDDDIAVMAKIKTSHYPFFENSGLYLSREGQQIRNYSDTSASIIITDYTMTRSEFQNKLRNSPVTMVYQKTSPETETLDQGIQDKLNNLRSFEDSNYVYTVLPNENNYLSDNLKPTLHAKFLYNNWYKEDRVINNLMIYNRALSNEEMLQNYKTIKRRWGM